MASICLGLNVLTHIYVDQNGEDPEGDSVKCTNLS